MKAIYVLFDSLNRLAMGCYGSAAVKTPNFDRFAKRAVTFDRHYVGSLPCMPARRDLHTGRLNFMHRSWGPLEPFDNSFPELMQQAGIHTHLVTDHMHYFEDGGATYHARFGWVGSGLSEANAYKIRATLDAGQPILVEVRYRGFTPAGELRHPSIQGWTSEAHPMCS